MGYTGEASPKIGTFLGLVCQRGRNSRVEIYKRVGIDFPSRASSLDEEQQYAVETSRSK